MAGLHDTAARGSVARDTLHASAVITGMAPTVLVIGHATGRRGDRVRAPVVVRGRGMAGARQAVRNDPQRSGANDDLQQRVIPGLRGLGCGCCQPKRQRCGTGKAGQVG